MDKLISSAVIGKLISSAVLGKLISSAVISKLSYQLSWASLNGCRVEMCNAHWAMALTAEGN